MVQSLRSIGRSRVLLLGLAVNVSILLIIVAVLVQSTPQPAEQPTSQGRGLATHEELIETWASHLQAGDYGQLRDLTVQGQSWSFDLLQEHAERERRNGRMQSYRVTRLEPAGTSANAVIHFVGGGKRDMCLPLQSDGSTINVTSDFRWCRDGE